jgi:hypothetical protein
MSNSPAVPPLADRPGKGPGDATATGQRPDSRNDPAAGKEASSEDTSPEESPGAGEPTPRELGGPKGPEPTRYGDWSINGRCSDF